MRILPSFKSVVIYVQQKGILYKVREIFKKKKKHTQRKDIRSRFSKCRENLVFHLLIDKYSFIKII